MIDLIEKIYETNGLRQLLDSAYFQHANELDRMQKMVDSTSFSFRNLEEQTREIAGLTDGSALVETQNMMNMMKDTYEPLQSMYKEALVDQQEYIDKFLGHDSSFLKQFLDEQKQLEKFYQPVSSYINEFTGQRELIEKYFEPASAHLKEFTDLYEQMREHLRPSELNKVDFRGFERLTDSLSNINFHFNRDGSLAIENELFSMETIQEKIDKVLIEKSIDFKEEPKENVINFIIKIALKTKESVIKVLILGLIINFISANVVEPLKEKLKRAILKENKKIIVKKIKNKKFPQEIDLSNLRFVIVETLNVREKNSRRSAKIGGLHLGDVVHIIRKKNDWSLVLFKNNEVVVQGWVLSRYIKKFSPQKINRKTAN